MISKIFFGLLVVVAVAQTIELGHSQIVTDYRAHPRYEFKYGVADGHTGDHKQQEEVRDGNVVKGSYSLLEKDRSINRVYYSEAQPIVVHHHGGSY